MNTASQSAYERLGGHEGVHTIIKDFITRVYDDMIIGFFFLKVDKANLIEKETEFAARHLGAEATYTGQTIPKAHGKHRINKGQFHRRLWLLEQTLKDHEVPEDIITEWLSHNSKLEAAVTDGTDCQPTP